jgi:hypothetical protein
MKSNLLKTTVAAFAAVNLLLVAAHAADSDKKLADDLYAEMDTS